MCGHVGVLYAEPRSGVAGTARSNGRRCRGADPGKMKSLKCGVCQATVMEMAYAINARENENGRKLREVEVVEVLDKICVVNMDKYGLMLDGNGKVGLVMVRRRLVSLLLPPPCCLTEPP